MCGIIGLHLKNPDLAPRLGGLLTEMLEAMTTRGPDSAGIAVYADPAPAGHGPGTEPGEEELRYSLRSDEAIDWDLLAKRIGAETGHDVRVERLGNDSALFGSPAAICARYGIDGWGGYQDIGHTRMATESAVTTAHSHPFAPVADLALVHNGSFSNYATIRRRLARDGIHCETDNDSEVAARLVAARMAEGADLEGGLRSVLKEMDGFFTLLVTTRTQFAVVRDSFACKPAVIAETDEYVAMASEYHALAGLPGITGARVFEPSPEEIHLWSR